MTQHVYAGAGAGAGAGANMNASSSSPDIAACVGLAVPGLGGGVGEPTVQHAHPMWRNDARRKGVLLEDGAVSRSKANYSCRSTSSLIFKRLLID